MENRHVPRQDSTAECHLFLFCSTEGSKETV